MQAFWDQVLDFSKAISTAVGTKLLDAFGNAQAEEKPDGSLVTEFDQWSDERLRAAIQEAFPEHGVLSEETTHVFPDNDWCGVSGVTLSRHARFWLHLRSHAEPSLPRLLAGRQRVRHA